MASYIIQKGDNLTRIARQFNVGHWRNIYEHPNNAAFRRKRPNPNLIYPGDVVFIPGQGEPTPVIDLGETIITVSVDPDKKLHELPEDERKKLLDDAREALPEDWKHQAESELEKIAWGLTIAQVLELSTLIGQGTWVIASPLVVAVRIVLGWASALETNQKMYGLRGVAYTTTAWAYGKPRPTESPEMMRLFRQTSSDATIQRRRDAWDKLSRQQWQYWESAWRTQNVSKEAMQSALKLDGIAKARHHMGTSEEKLCLAVLQSFEGEFRTGINPDNWKQGYRILYPR